MVVLFAYLATFILPLDQTFTLPYKYEHEFNQPSHTFSQLPYLIWVWANFDGFYYISIVKRGYFSGEEPFFPLYPFLISIFTFDAISPLISALFISHVAILAALVMVGKMLILDGKKNLIHLMYMILILFPTSFFYGAVYNDSLFFFLATLSLYFARKRLWFFSSVSGAFATLARLNGLALIFPIVGEYLFKEEKDVILAIKRLPIVVKKTFSLIQIIQSRIYSVVLIPLAFLSYLLYVQIVRGSWSVVFSSMKVWNQDQITFPLQVVWRYVKIIILHPTFQRNYWIAVFEAASVALYVFLMVYSFKKIRLSYWIFFVISILIPSVTGTFQGMPRYGLHLYPFFFALSLFLEKRQWWLKFLYFATSTILLGIATMLFTRGYFVA